jgi:collagen type III alpha
MSSGIAAPPPLPIETPLAAPPSERERFIEGRLRETRSRVKWVDLAVGLTTLALGTLAYLFVAALADHWLVSGGLGFFTRLVLWLLLLVGAVAYAIIKILPPLLHRVSPVYAAVTLEHSQPAMRNSLINFLLLRGRRQEVAAPVLQALETRAAADLARVRVDTAVDRTHLIRLCCGLAAVVAIFALYQVTVPKSPLRSAGRVLWPWTAAAAPTRVTISDVRPGDATVHHGDSLPVTAEITGLAAGEVPELVYSTADGQISAQAIAMNLPPGDYRHRCTLPPGAGGLQQDCTYYIRAGDSRTRDFKVLARTPPAIAVEKVELRFPDYTGLPPQSIARQGDLRAIEGAEATIHAEANTEIKPGSAEIDLGCTGLRGVRMEASGRKAVGRFAIRPRQDDPSRPQYDSYQLRFSDREGNENPRPARHRIEMIVDLPPEVQIVEPREPRIPLAENGRLTIRLRAADPDFGLRRVTLRMECDGRGLLMPPLMEKRKPQPAASGEFAAEYTFEPARFGLKAGQKIEFWAEAEDNKEPLPNHAATARQTIEILAPQRQDQQPSGDKQNQRNGQQDRQDKNQDKSDRSPDDKSDQGQQDKSEQGQKGQQDKSGQGQQDKSGQDKSGQGQQDKSGQEKSGQGQQDKSGQEKSGQGQQDKSGQEKSGQGQQDKSGQEKSAAEQQGAKGHMGQPGEQQQDGAQQGDQRDGPSGRGEGGQSGAGAQPQRIDPDAAPGDAMQEILDDMQRQQSAGRKPEAGPEQSGPKDGSQSSEQQGEQPGGGEKTDKQSPASASKPDQRRDSPGQGEQTGKPAGSPQPQEEAKPRDKKPEGTGQAPGEQKDEQAQSPGIDKHQSDSKGDTAGDRRGGGEQGGGQHAQKPGIGSAGENTPADQGAAQAQEPGQGETGTRAGKDAQADKPAGSETKTPVPAGKGTDSRGGEKGQSAGGETKSDQSAAGDHKDQKPAPDDKTQPNQKPADSRTADGLTQKPAQPSPAQGKSADQGSTGDNDKSSQGATAAPGTADGKSEGERAPIGGGKPGTPAEGKPIEMAESPVDQANLEYARRQTALALEHLRDQLAKEKPELLDRLGWTKDEARQFIERWEQMSRAAAQPTPAGAAARRELDEALRSLGLRPGGTQLRRGGTTAQRTEGLRDAGRFAPPPQWAEQFRAYTRGIAGENRGAAAEKTPPAEPRRQP